MTREKRLIGSMRSANDSFQKARSSEAGVAKAEIFLTSCETENCGSLLNSANINCTVCPAHCPRKSLEGYKNTGRRMNDMGLVFFATGLVSAACVCKGCATPPASNCVFYALHSRLASHAEPTSISDSEC